MVKNGKGKIYTMYKIFFDTNILVYSIDNCYPQKKSISRKILKKVAIEHYGIISTQVLQEFYVTSTKKLHIDPLITKDIIHSFEHFEVASIDVNLIKEAIDCSISNKLSFWDSLIICAAEYSNCKYLYSEDFNDQQIIRGVKVINPFINGDQFIDKI